MEDDFGLLEGFVYNKDNIIVLAASEKLEEEDVAHAFVCKFKQGNWDFWYEDTSLIKAAIFTLPSGPSLVMMGADGEIIVGDANGFRSETINTTDEAPSRLRPLNDMRRIEEHIYVVGMRRQVFRRKLSSSSWERYDNGLVVPMKSGEIAGLLSIDGFHSSEIYGVGYGGQIWHFNGKTWSNIDSPTSIRLESVRCVDNQFVIAVGHGGIILRGRENVWEVVQQDETEETFWDVETISGSIYISTEVGILYQLVDTNLVEVDTGINEEITTGNLHSNGNLLLSVGERDLLLFDGSNWTTIPLPLLSARGAF